SCHVAFDRQRQIDDPSVVQLNRRLGPPDGRYPERAQRKDQTDELLRHVSLLPLGGAPTGCDIHFSDNEAVAVYDKYGSYTCQIAKVDKLLVLIMRTTFVLALLLLVFGPFRAIAQNTPTWSAIRPVRIVVPFQAGGPIDTVGRIVAQQLSEQWGQSFIVENRTG